jgi:hypothetical protein
VLFIGADDGEIPRILQKEACGVTVNAGAVNEGAGWIKSISRDPSRRARMGDNARRLVLDKYNKRAALNNWKRLLGLPNEHP